MSEKLNTVKINLDNVNMGAGAAAKAYHHGDLKEALIAASEAVLAERGVDGFSLREAARRAGVSPAAPAHHFGDARGLLTAIATRGFQGLSQALRDANQSAPDRQARLLAQGRAYVHYALAQPARFDLMWRYEALNLDDPDYCTASLDAYGLLHELVTGGAPLNCGPDSGQPQAMDPRVAAVWSLVHGFALLARGGTFDPSAPGLLDGVLSSVLPGLGEV